MGTFAAALLSGTVFGAGLAISGMIHPAKVLAFLDVSGAWDPDLALVMMGALAVTLPTFQLVQPRLARPWLDAAFQLPTRRDLDARLLGGACLFGVGWGLGGFCPGPALAALASGDLRVLAFVAAMLAGMATSSLLEPRPASRARSDEAAA